MDENLSEFLKIAYKYGRVKNIEEAFEGFPVEEWHKGKLEYLEEFNRLLSEFYTTGEKEKIKEFLFKNCIDGIVL